jgi:cytochrome c556
MQRIFGWVISGAVVISLFGVAYAQFAKPEQAIAYRRATMTLIGDHFGRIGAVVKGDKQYDPKETEQNATLIATLATLPWDAFTMADTDKGETHMKPEVLKDKEGFRKAADDVQMETAKLAEATAKGELSAVKSQFGATAKSCKACHDKYRSQ